MAAPSEKTNPYIGPRPFQNTPGDIARFFGRGREARDILALIIARRTLVFYGKSGTGKSSLLNAAIIPALVERQCEVLPAARVQGIIPDDRDAETIPNLYMANVLAGWATSGQDTPFLTRVTLSDYLKTLPHHLNEEDDPTLRILIFDQFEELFTAYPRRWRERETFFQQVSEALAGDRFLRVVFVIREDNLAELDRYASLLPDGMQTTFRLERLRYDQALLAVKRPVETTQRSYADGAAEKLVTELLTIREVGKTTAAVTDEYVEPVVLQVVCESLWRMLPEQTLTIGVREIEQYAQVNNALLVFYEQCIQTAVMITGTPQAAIRDWFEHVLITSTGARNVVAEESSQTGGLPNEVVHALEDLHLIRAEDRGRTRLYELVHDRFIEPILESNRRHDPELFRERRRLERQRAIIRFGLLAMVLLVLIVALIVGTTLARYSRIVAQYKDQVSGLIETQPLLQTVRILDVNNNLIAELNSPEGGTRRYMTMDAVSPFFIHAVISLEGERFFEDPGWDWITIFRAFLQTFGAGQVESGASPITHQVARQLVLRDSTVSPQSKLEEIVIASQIAQQYSKNEILELYLNEVYLGNQNYGVEAASQFYFDHTAAELTLPEAAMLAGIIAAPAEYDPVQRREPTFDRMDQVIQRMIEAECLQFQHTPYLERQFCVTSETFRNATVDVARVKSSRYEPRTITVTHPHFVQFVQQIIERNYGPGEMYRRGFTIRTTFNPNLQNEAEAALRRQVALLSVAGVNTGAIMVTDPRTGAIRAMVGSPDFNNSDIDGQVNGALVGHQPGAVIAPVIYTAALEGTVNPNTSQLTYMTPATILWDVPTTFPTNPPYTPINLDGRFRGPVDLRHALQNNINVTAVKVYDFIGSPKFQDMAARMGLRFPEGTPLGLPTALGVTETTLYDMMAAYGTLANNGSYRPLYVVERINDSAGNPVIVPDRDSGAQAVQPQIAYLMQNMLSDDTARADAFGTNGPLTITALPRSDYVAARTGFSDGARDLWTLGFTSNAVVGVWLGSADNAPTLVQRGGYGSVAPLWNEVMRATLRTLPAPQPFLNPGGVVQAPICAFTGTLPPANCSALRIELFAENQPPPSAEQAFVQTVAIDTWTGLRANQYCPENVITETFVNISDPFAVAWLNTVAGRPVATQLGLGADLQAAPSGACDLNTALPIARITAPTEDQTVSGVVQIVGAASAVTFNRYQLEVAPVGMDNFQIIDGPITSPRTGDVLGRWDTLTFPNGGYRLRLAMFSNDGGYLYRTVNVNLFNAASALPTWTPPPTTTPTVTALPTVLPTATATATPSPTVIPTMDSFLVTATALVRRATEMAVDRQTATANALTPSATLLSFELEPPYLTATAIIARATAMESVNQTATADVIRTPIPTTPAFVGTGCIHEIQPGENLFRISMLYGVPVSEIASANGLSNANLLLLGQRLVIPGCGTTGALPPPTGTPAPSLRPAVAGENTGLVTDASETWVYLGQADEVLTLRVEAENPVNGPKNDAYPVGVLDTMIIITGPNGTVLAVADDIQPNLKTDSIIENLILPSTGDYQIEISSFAGLSSGGYRLIIQSNKATASS